MYLLYWVKAVPAIDQLKKTGSSPDGVLLANDSLHIALPAMLETSSFLPTSYLLGFRFRSLMDRGPR